MKTVHVRQALEHRFERWLHSSNGIMFFDELMQQFGLLSHVALLLMNRPSLFRKRGLPLLPSGIDHHGTFGLNTSNLLVVIAQRLVVFGYGRFDGVCQSSLQRLGRRACQVLPMPVRCPNGMLPKFALFPNDLLDRMK